MGVIIRQSIKGTIVNYVGIVIGFFTTFFVLTRFLTAEEIGLTRVLIEAATLVAGLAQLGTNSSIIRFYPYFKDAEHRDHGFFFWSLLVPLIGFLVVSVLFVALRDTISSVFIEKSELFVDYYYFVLPLSFFMLYMTVFETNANVLMRIVVPKLTREVVVRVLLLASYLLYAFRVITIDGFVSCFCGLYGVATLINIGYLLSLKRISIKPNFSHITKSLRRDYLFYTLFLVTAALVGVITPSINTFFISAKMGLNYAGVFAIATYIAALVEIPYRSLGAIAQPQLSQAIKERDFGQANRLMKNVALHQFLIGTFIFFAIWINIDLLFELLPNGEQYSVAKWVVLILLTTKLINSMFGINISALGYSRFYYFSLIFTFVLTATAIILNNHLIPIWGINGAALASLLSIATYQILIYLLLRRKMKFNLFSVGQLKILAIFGTIMALNWAISEFVLPLWLPNFAENMLVKIAEAALRTVAFASLGVLAIYKWNVSENVNSLLNKILKIK